MNDERDPKLQAIFAEAEQELPSAEFTAAVMAKTRKARVGRLVVWVCIALAVAICAWLLALPLQGAVHLLMERLTAPLIELSDPQLGQMLSPFNNAMILLGLGLIALRGAYRKIFS